MQHDIAIQPPFFFIEYGERVVNIGNLFLEQQMSSPRHFGVLNVSNYRALKNFVEIVFGSILLNDIAYHDKVLESPLYLRSLHQLCNIFHLEFSIDFVIFPKQHFVEL